MSDQSSDKPLVVSLPGDWKDSLQKWAAARLSLTATKADAVRAIIANELGARFPGESIRPDHKAERAERAEAYLEAKRELGSITKVAERYGKSRTAIERTINTYLRDQR